MEVVLLGTGSADGWPNPFCRCASCAAQAAAGELRSPTAALVDDVLLLDCGPEAPRSALRAGRRLDRLAAVLLTGARPDPSAPTALLSRARARRHEPLLVAGPAAVLERWRAETAPEGPVRWQPVGPGDVVEVAGYAVQALAAAHERPAVLYLVEDGAGARLLYGAGTGPLPEETVASLAERPADLLLLEETSGRGLARLRAAGAVRDGAEVVAVHLGHHNPPSPRLDARLAAWGARPGRDGEVIALATPAPALITGSRHPARTLVLGGARSGKSTAAERLLGSEPVVTYVATGPAADGSDPAWAERVRRHRERRPADWRTVETADAAAALRSARTPVLLDCLGTWLTGVLTGAGAWEEAPGWQQRAQAGVDDLLAAWRDVRVPVVAVSNEVGSGVVPAHASGIVFRDWLGRLNQAVGDASERVLLVVAGRAVELT
jgi:adenosylcobinamide kinase/adenosylcobinamide-phosphate guanylyltransferase